MNQIEKKLYSFLIWLTVPISWFLGLWWTCYFFTNNEKIISTMMLVGIITGIAIVVVLHIKYKVNPYKIPKWRMILIFLFYSICLFGFFMGVPLFHLFLGLLAGCYWSRRMIFENKRPETYKIEIKKVSLFTATMMGIICVLSASIALSDKFTAGNLQGMLSLSFHITFPMLIAFIAAGGILLVLIQYWATKLAMNMVMKR
ncbi:MAG: hypothetical protein LLG05_07465 [Porphyromonadaceae bacterium]|jgi:hypothetical protein|nr:hypothetical protein [Porphyromonadaceae bacterium]